MRKDAVFNCITRCVSAFVLMVTSVGSLAADPKPGPYQILFAGQMTDNHWEEVFVPGKVEFLESWFIGLGRGYEWSTRLPRTTLGIEGQLVGHFRIQDHLEFNVPVVIRYYPAKPIVPPLDSIAFGLGLSTTTKKPQTEINRDGETSRTLIYWMGELDFDLPQDGISFAVRLHHRSDAYGLFATDSGANAIAFGIKHRF